MMATFFAWMRERSASASWYAFAMIAVDPFFLRLWDTLLDIACLKSAEKSGSVKGTASAVLQVFCFAMGL
jgi:hypothetical protein